MIVVKTAVALSGPSVTITGEYDPGEDNQLVPQAENQTNLNQGIIALAAGLAISATGVGSALALGTAASASAAAITERPESFGKLLVLLALIEAIAIYGFVIAFILSGKI
ncbi:MAG: ATP synthase subunit C [Asgard group archaeon]|nr:ATP synthase subunit C [Asgard group archaeon]